VSAVQRAAEVAWTYVSNDDAYWIAQALADAGLLLSDADRAVLDAADRQECVMTSRAPYSPLPAIQNAIETTNAAVRARRETQRPLREGVPPHLRDAI
jgi:hypothetical protein